MACHEIAALRLGLMNIVGIEDAAERAHELAELGDTASRPGPLKSTLEARTLTDMLRAYQASLTTLEDRLGRLPLGAAERPYLQTLVVLTKKTELDVDNQIAQLTRLFRDLEHMHDLVHEIYPTDDV